MPTISPSELLRQKRLQIQSNPSTVKAKIGNVRHGLNNAPAIKIAAVNTSTFISPTLSQKVTVATTKSTTQAKKL